MTITALPTPPSRDDPANFADEADAFLGALPTFATEANALAVDVNADAVSAAADAASADTDANTAASAAATASAAAASVIDINKKYLGAKAVAPTLDNEGQPLAEGALYFDTVADALFAYNGTSWVVAYAPAGDYVTNSGASVSGNVAIFSGTSGKSITDSGSNIASLGAPPFLLYAQGII